jgi:predicted DNA-binding transcriptional regulator AlpA
VEDNSVTQTQSDLAELLSTAVADAVREAVAKLPQPEQPEPEPERKAQPVLAPVWLDTNQVGQRYGVHPATIRLWVRDGRFPPPTQIGPRANRWHVERLDEYDAHQLGQAN